MEAQAEYVLIHQRTSLAEAHSCRVIKAEDYVTEEQKGKICVVTLFMMQNLDRSGRVDDD